MYYDCRFDICIHLLFFSVAETFRHSEVEEEEVAEHQRFHSKRIYWFLSNLEGYVNQDPDDDTIVCQNVGENYR